ncbi:acyl-homoserine-lactone synthase [Methylobacterium durans]|uniref:Acyl-homoserine-lactone synthase n=1 Tax=Methylobacterium durans TaxID=2202825 RepID=A0A2U8W6Z3_9HYPH|nr:acyl-homoserine-lactone synthase [Methylobacterium durans]AWN41391.1 hypothetical protein DK389_13805 [Methylobacterium durans]
MFKLLSGEDGSEDPDLMEKVYRFRHAFFVEHLKWEACRKPDGREIDEFDTPECYHVVGLAGDAVVSYSRLLPTTRPHLQTHLYPEILKGPPLRPVRGSSSGRAAQLPRRSARAAGARTRSPAPPSPRSPKPPSSSALRGFWSRPTRSS